MFDAFRRRQKSMLAVLTLLAMFAFAFPVTSFLGNSRALQQNRDLNTVVATINGRQITRENLSYARHEKQLANAFVFKSILAVGDLSRANLSPRFIDELYGFGSTESEEDIKDSLRMASKADEY